MNTLPTRKLMKNRIYALLLGLAFALTSASTGHAMSELVSVSFEPLWPETSTPGNVILYKVTAVVREGSGLLEVALSSQGLPEGATVTFSPSVLKFTGNAVTIQSAIMAVTCPGVMPTETYPFTVTGNARREAITLTNQVPQDNQSLISGPPTLWMDALAGGGLRVRGKGVSGRAYQVEGSPSLVNPNWTLLGSSTADGNGRFSFLTAKPAGANVWFYRAVEAAPGQ
jgi:hypothetical protein